MKSITTGIVTASFFLVFLCRPAIADDQGDYLTVSGPCQLEFPKDHGAHPGYRTEWWYYTGHLRTESGDPYGFQLTFFRSQIVPPGADRKWPQPPSAWRTRQIYLAHAAISDIAGKQHLQSEQIARQALGMAGSSQTADATVVFLGNWSAQIKPDVHLLKVESDGFSYELTLTPLKPPILHGLGGYSLKGSTPERASCYYSFTRLAAEGRIFVKGKASGVTGNAWMDHEFSTAPLEPGITGWDWFSLQLADRTEIMVFLLRRDSGEIASVSSGTFVDAGGAAHHLSKDQFDVSVLDTWKSKRSKALYPARWRLQIFPLDIDLTIVPNLADQEMHTSASTGVVYWEGSVAIKGTRDGAPLEGQGYVELTGYAGPMDAPM
jgi:predicted secreted hydrolase